MSNTPEHFINPYNPDAWGPMAPEVLEEEHRREAMPEGWLREDQAPDLRLLINAKYPDEDLNRLADYAAEAAVSDADLDECPPDLIETARNAVQIALGLRPPYPEEVDESNTASNEPEHEEPDITRTQGEQ